MIHIFNGCYLLASVNLGRVHQPTMKMLLIQRNKVGAVNVR